jgi:hypothetical protein
MGTPKRIGSIVALAVVLCSATVLTGCGTSVADLCDEMCDCEDCSDADYDECVAQGEEIEEDAEKVGCGDEFADYVDCIVDSASCEDGRFRADTDCMNEIASCGEIREAD